MLNSVNISYFRSFRDLKLTGFERINVFVGKNNLGKSSILEAIYLVSNGRDILHPSPLMFILQRRGINSFIHNSDVNGIIKYLREHVFYRGEEEARIITENGKKIDILFKEPFKHIKTLIEPHFNELDENTQRFLQKNFFSKRREISVIGAIYVNNRPEILLIEQGRPLRFYKIVYLIYKVQKSRTKFFLDTCTLCGSSEKLSTLIKKLELYQKEGTYEKLLKLLSDYFEYKILSIEPSFSDFYVNTSYERMPFSMLGDGIRYFTTHFLILNMKDNSYIFFEEPENYMHPKMLDSLVNAITDSNHQVFIVTHSIEFLRKLLWKAKVKKQGLKVFGIYGLSSGKAEIESYDLNKAYVALNKLDIDLR